MSSVAAFHLPLSTLGRLVSPTSLVKNIFLEKVIESVDHLVNPLDNAINEKCSRIKKVFLSMMDEYSASYYFISSHTQKHFVGSSRIWYERLKVITLPRELVVSQALELCL